MEYVHVKAKSAKLGEVSHTFRKVPDPDYSGRYRKVFARRMRDNGNQFEQHLFGTDGRIGIEYWWEHVPDRKLYCSTGQAATTKNLTEWLVMVADTMANNKLFIDEFFDKVLIIGGEMCQETLAEPVYFFHPGHLGGVTAYFDDAQKSLLCSSNFDAITLFTFRYDEVSLLLEACEKNGQPDVQEWLEENLIECVCADYQSHLYTRDVRAAEFIWEEIRSYYPVLSDEATALVAAEAMKDLGEAWNYNTFVTKDRIYTWAEQAMVQLRTVTEGSI